MDTQGTINQVVQQYGQAAIQVLRQIAAYLETLQVERPELFEDGVLVDDWIARLQAEPLPVEVLPEPEPVDEPGPEPEPIQAGGPAPVVMPTLPVIDFDALRQALQAFGNDIAAVVKKVLAFLLYLQTERPDLFEDGRLVSDWMLRLQSAPLPPQVLPGYDPVLVPTEEPEPEPLPEVAPPLLPEPLPEVAPEPSNDELVRYELDRIRSALAVLYALLKPADSR